jgi:hypothetical protein
MGLPISQWCPNASTTRQAPAVLVFDRRGHGRARRDGTVERGIRIFHDHYHAHSPAAERFGTEVLVLWRLVGDPEFGRPNGQPGNYRPIPGVDAEYLAGTKCRLLPAGSAGPVFDDRPVGRPRLRFSHATRAPTGHLPVSTSANPVHYPWPYLDRVLTDDSIYGEVRRDLGQRYPQTLCHGRHSTPAETLLRLILVKHLYNWSYREAEVRVADSHVVR